MTESTPTPAELIAEARRWPQPDERNPFEPAAPPSDMVQRLADALEAASVERDALAAVIEQVKADAWDEGFEQGVGFEGGVLPWLSNPYRIEREAQ